MSFKTLHKIEEFPGDRKRAVFCISTQQGDQFLCTDNVADESLDQFSVVEVKSDYFVELWRNDTYEAHLDVSQGNPSTWIKDKKFLDAQKGFSHGEANPVPLAYVHCAIRDEERDVWRRRYLLFREYVGRQVVKRVPYITFTDGITRTIWLLTHGAQYFPVMCDRSNAELLQLMAGEPDGKALSLKELLSCA